MKKPTSGRRSASRFTLLNLTAGLARLVVSGAVVAATAVADVAGLVVGAMAAARAALVVIEFDVDGPAVVSAAVMFGAIVRVMAGPVVETGAGEQLPALDRLDEDDAVAAELPHVLPPNKWTVHRRVLDIEAAVVG